VETPEQLAFLLHHGCDEIQGYLFSKPLTVDEMSAWLHADKRLAVSEEARIHYQQ
jgi:EAL domain-containing protein (putative c-di-GMP-specific phosphodiesterase class I)